MSEEGPEIDWDSQPLGHQYDRDIAERLGTTVEKVKYERRARGKAAYKATPIDWENVKWEGRSTPEIAKELNRSISCVRQNRERLGEPPFEGQGTRGKKRNQRRRPTPKLDWDEVPYGTASDEDLAAKYKTTAHTIGRKRRQRGIEKYDPRRIDWDSQPFHLMDNTALGRALGVDRSTVRYQRARRGHPPFEESETPTNWRIVDWEKDNRQLAKELGHSIRWVQFQRRAHKVKK